ncbi:hypothetical protein DRE_00029 [Drechslerella stenobrocha 248]|uniref:HMG box domain-containing protein n=1 Tax=Drechslerella stenobrocha 248 TaxID=1043628 RepID=W7HYY6_9PEZI|nr:hypothetical protein DRE_00029 [Drechslerella stenobrocha 248]
MAQNPGKSNPAISKIIGEMWKNVSEDTRKEWQNHADEEKRQHMARYPEYRYQPRRSSKKGGGSSSAGDQPEPSRCSRCGGRTGAYSVTDSPSFPVLPAPTASASAPAVPGPSRSSSLRDLLGPSISPADHKRKRSDEAGYFPGAEALLQLGSNALERDYPSRSTHPPIFRDTATGVKEPASAAETESKAGGGAAGGDQPRPWKRNRIEDTDEFCGEIARNPDVNAIASRTATSPAMSYHSTSELPHGLERRASDPTLASYRQLQHPRHETFSPDYLEPPYTHAQHHQHPHQQHQHHHGHHQRHYSLHPQHHARELERRIPTVDRPTTSTPTPLAPTDKIQQIQRITRPLPLRHPATPSTTSSAAAATSRPLSHSHSSPPPPLGSRPFIIAVEATDTQLAGELCFQLHADLVDRFRDVRIHRPMDVPEWRQFLHGASGPEDLASDYLHAVAAARHRFDAMFTPVPLQSWERDQQQPQQQQTQFRTLPSPAPAPFTVSILQQYILTHATAAKRRLSPGGNSSPVYTWEWCVDVWRGSPRPDMTVIVRNDDGMGVVAVEDAALGLLSVPAPVSREDGRLWNTSVIRRLAFEVRESINGRYGGA